MQRDRLVKVCARCARRRKVKFFRQLTSGYLQGMCRDCEREYERKRWHSRSPQSKATSGGACRRSRGESARRRR